MLKFTLESDHSGTTTWIATGVFRECDWPIWFYRKMLDMWELLPENEWPDLPGRWLCEIHAVSARAILSRGQEGRATLRQAFKTVGIRIKDGLIMEKSLTKSNGPSEQSIHSILLNYGTSAPLWSAYGPVKRELLKQSNMEFRIIQIHTGFYLAEKVNAIGETGWDWLKGNIG